MKNTSIVPLSTRSSFKALCTPPKPTNRSHYRSRISFSNTRPRSVPSSHSYKSLLLIQYQLLSPMSTKALSSDLPTRSFASSTEFEAFLEREHTTAPGLFLKLAKKSSGIATISSTEAVEIALCFGWIDGRANRIDDNWWSVRYTPRRPKSIWSQKNVKTIGRLMEQGRMRPAGLATVEAAKADGRWDRAYAGPATIVVPDDLATALAANPRASTVFASMNKSDRYAVLWRIETSSEQSRTKRINTTVQTLAATNRPRAAAKAVGKSMKNTGVQKTTTKVAVDKKQGSSTKKGRSSLPAQDAQVMQPRREGLRSRPQGQSS